MEGKDGVLSLSIAHGFPWSDIKEMGSKIIAITDGDKAKAERLARASSARNSSPCARPPSRPTSRSTPPWRA